MMTPLQINMMLHYYAVAEPYSKDNSAHASSQAVAEQRDKLISCKMLQYDNQSLSGYSVTERGKAYVDFLISVPLPTMKWEIKFDQSSNL